MKSISKEEVHKKSNKKYLILVLLFLVFVDETADTSMIKLSASFVRSDLWVLFFLYGLQVIFATLQAGLSDFYFRKKSLIISIVAVIISIVFLKISEFLGMKLLIVSLILKGMMGNVIPIARAGLADISLANNFRLMLAFSICSIALGSWAPIYFFPHFSRNFIFAFNILICICALLFLLRHQFEDKRDHPISTIAPEKVLHSESSILLTTKEVFIRLKKETNDVYCKFIKKLFFFSGFVAYFFAEASFYQILFRLEIFHKYFCFKAIPLELGLGYYLGTLFIRFFKFNDRKNTILGIALSLFCIFSITFLDYIDIDTTIPGILLITLYSAGFAIFIPCMFSIISHRHHYHDQGKIYGLVDSFDTLAAIAALALILLIKSASCDLVLLISSLIFTISLVPFVCFLFMEDMHGKNQNNIEV